MKTAVISVSREGALLGQRVRAAMDGMTCYERAGAESGGEAQTFRRTAALTAEIFSRYDGLLYIMASGIAVRAIAPHIVSKASDPAVLVMDECGKHCISLLSGHLGGANAWAREVSAAVGADAVITTATDVHGRPAPDDIARQLCMRVEPLGALKAVNSAIAEGKPFVWLVDPALPFAERVKDRLRGAGIDALTYGEADGFAAAAVVSEGRLAFSVPHVYLRPRNLFVGMGCRRGAPKAHVRDAFSQVLAAVGAMPWQVKALASVDVKANEPGLLEFAEEMGLPIHFYPAEELKRWADAHQVAISEFVEKTIGVGNVCESAALREAWRGKTLLPKTKFADVTAAVAVGLSVSSASDRGTRKK